MTRIALLFLAVNALLQAQGTPAKNPAANNPHLGNPQSIRSGMALYRIALRRLPWPGCRRVSRPRPDRASSRAARPTSGCSIRFERACPGRKCRR